MNTLTVAQAAYIAGFVDGEGCITYFKSKKHVGSSKYHLQLTLSIVNTNKEVLDWICLAVGAGKVYKLRPANKTKNHKASWQIRWYCNEARAVIKQIMPYLQVKRGRAELVLQMAAINKEALEEAGLKNFIGKELPSELLQKREQIFQQIRKLNTRGIN